MGAHGVLRYLVLAISETTCWIWECVREQYKILGGRRLPVVVCAVSRSLTPPAAAMRASITSLLAAMLSCKTVRL